MPEAGRELTIRLSESCWARFGADSVQATPETIRLAASGGHQAVVFKKGRPEVGLLNRVQTGIHHFPEIDSRKRQPFLTAAESSHVIDAMPSFGVDCLVHG